MTRVQAFSIEPPGRGDDPLGVSEPTKTWTQVAIVVATICFAGALATPKQTAHAKAIAGHFWYSTLGQCATSVRSAVDDDPALWARDVRVEKCRPSARDGEQMGPIEVCIIDHVVNGARVTESLAVNCSTGAIFGLTP